jgi:integrase
LPIGDEPPVGRLGTLDDSGLRRRFVAALGAAGVRRRRWHDLRHSIGSMAVRHFDPVAVQMMMGHSSLKTTMRYLHVSPATMTPRG